VIGLYNSGTESSLWGTNWGCVWSYYNEDGLLSVIHEMRPKKRCGSKHNNRAKWIVYILVHETCTGMKLSCSFRDTDWDCRNISVAKLRKQMSWVKCGKAHIKYSRLLCCMKFFYEFNSKDRKRAKAPVVFSSGCVSSSHLVQYNAWPWTSTVCLCIDDWY
jgi:hypothetical protein